jgi:hypothetical protein
MERAGNHPSVTTVVTGTGSDEYAGAEQVTESIRQYHRRGASGVLHQRGELETGRHGAVIPAVGLFGGENGDGQSER